MLLRAAFIIALCLTAAACANPNVGAPDKISFVSEPPGATARTNVEQECVTPCDLSIGKKVNFDVTFSLDGHRPQTVSVVSQPKASANGEMALFALAGGVGGLASAQMNGYTLEHIPNPVAVMLVSERAPSAGKARARKLPKAGDKLAMRAGAPG
ncbi:MAG: hypothetical protein QOC72_1243 [Methylobacteriaceae bacterium]|jgi:hypothetical protein|nr:hypothetical protein [Methylobacteriaceae bacterium]